MAGPLQDRARDLWQAWGTRGTCPRPAPAELIRTLYGFWCAALALKVLGSGWDVAWHFRWLRDDLAPPHLLNTAGTVLVIALIAFHAWTGYGVDRPSLRLMLVGIVVFLVAIPIDVVNHRINGLDITAWSVTHGLLYFGTALLMAGAVRGWWRYGSGSMRAPVLTLLWAFVLENVWFPTGQQEYGVLAVEAWDRGRPDAEAVLLQFVADQIGRPVDRSVVLHFALPMPDWLYPVWLIAAAGFVLVLARWMIGFRWAATTVAAAYVGYRCVAWAALVAGGFPPSALPFLLIAVAVAVDLVFLVRMPDFLRPLFGALLVGLAAFGGAAAQQEKAPIPPIDPIGFGTGTLVLAVLWILTWVLVRSGPFRRWAAEH